MPAVVRTAENGFTAAQVTAITGLSLPMVDYLARTGFLRPAYAKEARRGRVRYYSYRDLVVARLVQRLRETGIELYRLKYAIRRLAQATDWTTEVDPAIRLRWLVSDGHEVALKNEDGFLDTFRKDGQRVFAFLVNLDDLTEEVRQRIPEAQSASFSLRNRPLRFAPADAHGHHRAS